MSRPKGYKQSQETINKRAEKNRGQKRSEEVRKKMSETRRGIARRPGGWKQTEETKEKIRQTRLGTKMPTRSQEYRDKISKLHKGKIVSAETREKISLARRGKPSVRKGVKLSDETKEKIRQANIGKKYSEEVRRKVSEAGKGRAVWNKGITYKSPKQSIAIKGSKNPNWRGGISFEEYSEKWNDILREAIRKRDEYKCNGCGLNQEVLTGFHKQLDVHHIDYNKYNLDQSNLVSLCKSCHAKTNFNREFWFSFYSKLVSEK